MTEEAERLVERTLAPLGGMDIPPRLRANIERHQANLLNLASSLLAGGVDRRMVEESIAAAFRSYQNELVTAILSLKGGDSHGH